MSRTLIVLHALAVALSVAACGPTASREREMPEPREVTVALVSARKVPVVVEAGGVVEPRTMAVVASRIAAVVVAVHVQAGDTVRAGQRLITLDGRDLTAEYARADASVESTARMRASIEAERDAADAALALTRSTHERIVGLQARGSATDQERDEVVSALVAAEARRRAVDARLRELEASLASARAGLEAAGVRASFAVLAAPFDGLVTEKSAEPGNLATPGAPLLRLEALDSFRLQVRVDESRAGLLAVGLPADVTIPRRTPDAGTADLHLTGSVVEIARAVDASPYAFLVKIELPAGEGLRSGLFARVRVQVAERDALVVPADALRRQGQLPTLFVASDSGTVRMRVVSVGAPVDGGIEILSGVVAGESIVASPPADLHDGDAISPVRAAAARGAF